MALPSCDVDPTSTPVAQTQRHALGFILNAVLSPPTRVATNAQSHWLAELPAQRLRTSHELPRDTSIVSSDLLECGLTAGQQESNPLSLETQADQHQPEEQHQNQYEHQHQSQSQNQHQQHLHRPTPRNQPEPNRHELSGHDSDQSKQSSQHKAEPQRQRHEPIPESDHNPEIQQAHSQRNIQPNRPDVTPERCRHSVQLSADRQSQAPAHPHCVGDHVGLSRDLHARATRHQPRGERHSQIDTQERLRDCRRPGHDQQQQQESQREDQQHDQGQLYRRHTHHDQPPQRRDQTASTRNMRSSDPRPVKKKTPMSYEEKRKARKCTVVDCQNYTINKGRCFRHGGGTQCSVDGCKASAKVAGLCWKHGGSVPCVIDGCERRGKSRGLCWAHGGGSKCQADACVKVAVSNGLCWAHGGGKRCVYDGCRRPGYERTFNFCPRHYDVLQGGQYTVEL
ncbi:hypothetical protein PINS_up013737 [Pythium insidiosum]|nr:hypothetical protein PINS_up013737 [Pythium insidiosum]